MKGTFSMDEDKIKKLTDYYKNDGLTIIGMNDSQAVNTTSTIFKKGLLEYLGEILTTDELNPTVINTFSLLMNKTEHIDYFLRSNLNLEEIKLSRVYGVVKALEKVMSNYHLPKILSNVGYMYKVCALPKEGDAKIFLTSTLEDAKEPIIIYSSGGNNLMREVGSNPYAINRDYKRRDIRPNYNYTLGKINDKRTLNKVMLGIERNFYNILSINSSSDIYALGIYVPYKLTNEEMKIIQELVLKYNDHLISLSEKYHVTYIDTCLIGNMYNRSKTNIHINSKGQIALDLEILNAIYNNKFVDIKDNIKEYSSFDYNSKGSVGIMDKTLKDMKETKNLALMKEGYERKRLEEIADEHRREYAVFDEVQKTLTKRKKRYTSN